jgi:hypothetical protein
MPWGGICISDRLRRELILTSAATRSSCSTTTKQTAVIFEALRYTAALGTMLNHCYYNPSATKDSEPESQQRQRFRSLWLAVLGNRTPRIIATYLVHHVSTVKRPRQDHVIVKLVVERQPAQARKRMTSAAALLPFDELSRWTSSIAQVADGTRGSSTVFTPARYQTDYGSACSKSRNMWCWISRFVTVGPPKH